MSSINDHQVDLNTEIYNFKEEIKRIDGYRKYLDAVVDNGYFHNFCGPVADSSRGSYAYRLDFTRAYKYLYEISVNETLPFVLPLTKPVGNPGVLLANGWQRWRSSFATPQPLDDIEAWLKDGARAPIPPLVELPKTNFTYEFIGDFDYPNSGLKKTLDSLKEVVANNQTLVDTYNERVNDFCQRQNQVHAEVLATAQAIQRRIKVCREDGDLSGWAATMQDLMDFLIRRVRLVGMSNTRKHMVLAVESRTAFVQVQFPDCAAADMFIGWTASDSRKFANVSTKKKLIQASIYSTAIYFGQLVGRFGLPEVFDTVVVNIEQDWFDPATGHPRNGIVASLQAKRDVFANLDLEKIDPVACFRELKGLSTPNMNAPTPIRPIMQLQTTDSRFVESRDVDLEVDPQSNLAAMDWEDFEHLIAQLMEWEFARAGVEVRVTRASRDRGVDAVMFDPDPLRGGKYVLQAKRYTRTVDVSAVRDLYGTLLNEGANRGILITTASFGPDAYEFAKDKPLSLVDGPNLLNLLSRHGKIFRIDLEEARRLQVGTEA